MKKKTLDKEDLKKISNLVFDYRWWNPGNLSVCITYKDVHDMICLLRQSDVLDGYEIKGILHINYLEIRHFDNLVNLQTGEKLEDYFPYKEEKGARDE